MPEWMENLNLCGFLNLEQGVWKDKWLARKDKFGIRCYGQEMVGVKGLESDCCDGLTVHLTNVHFFAFLSGVIFAKVAPSSWSLSSLSLDDDSSWVHPWLSRLLLWVPLWYFTPLSPCLGFFSGTEYIFAVLLIEVSMLTSVFIRYARAAATICTGMARFLHAAGLGSIHMREWPSDGSRLTCLTHRPQSLIMGCTQACNNNWNCRCCLFQLFQGGGGSSVSLLHEFHRIFDVCSHLRSQCSFWKIGEDLFFNWSLKVDQKNPHLNFQFLTHLALKTCSPDLSQFPRLVYKVLLIHV